MEAKDADRSHQDICHFVATASLISDKASSPVGTVRGGGGRKGEVSVSKQWLWKAAVKVMWWPFFKQLVPITANHMRSVAVIIILGSRHQSCHLWVLTRGCAVISGLHWQQFHHQMFSKYWMSSFACGGGGVFVGGGGWGGKREWCPTEIIKT